MRSVLVIAALSCATLVAAQDDSPEAPPLNPPSNDDSDSSSSSTSTSTSTTTTTSITSTTEVESTSTQPAKPATDEEMTTTKPAPEQTTIEPEIPTTIDDASNLSTETKEGGFITIYTETPGTGSSTDTSSPPTVTAAGSGFFPQWSNWAVALTVVLATTLI